MLYSSGASKFAVYTLPALGCFPIVRQEFNTGNDCYEKLNDLAKQHNARLGPMLNDLARARSGFQFTVFDFYNVILRRTQRNMNFRKYYVIYRYKIYTLVIVNIRYLELVFDNTCCD